MKSQSDGRPLTLDEVEAAVSKLSPEDIARFGASLEKINAANFDRQIERDIRAEKPDKSADKTLADLKNNRLCKP